MIRGHRPSEQDLCDVCQRWQAEATCDNDDIFWPGFELHFGRVFVSSFFRSSNFRFPLGRCNDTLQKFSNMIDVQYVVQDAEPAFTESELELVAETLVNTWSEKLGIDFPERKIVVVAENFLDDSVEREILVWFCEEAI